MMPTRLVSHNIIKTEYKTYEKLSLRLAIIVVLRVVICLFEFLVLSLEKRSQWQSRTDSVVMWTLHLKPNNKVFYSGRVKLEVYYEKDS